MTTIMQQDGKILVETPFEPSLPAKFRQMGGSWNDPYWTFKEDTDVFEGIKELLLEKLGYDHDSPKGIVKITTKNKVIADKKSVIVGGFILAYARGRSSGAKVGAGVTLIRGEIGSGGSMKNWDSRVHADTTFKINGFPLSQIECYMENYTIEVIGGEDKTQAAFRIIEEQMGVLKDAGVNITKLQIALENTDRGGERV